MVCLDVSESMNYGDPPKISQAASVARRAIEELGPEDEAALVAFGSDAEILVNPSPAKDLDAERILGGIAVRGVTCLSEGLKACLELLEGAGPDSVLLLITDGRANLSLDRLGGFEGSTRLEDEAVSLLRGSGLSFRFYGVAVGEDAFTGTLRRMAEELGGAFCLAEDFRGLASPPGEQSLEAEFGDLEVRGIPSELPAAQPTWTKESQTLHVSVVSDEIFEKYRAHRRAFLINEIKEREARTALMPISSPALEPYRRRRPRTAGLVEGGGAILLDRTYRDFLSLQGGRRIALKLFSAG